MLYTEPRVVAHPPKLGYFDNYDQHEAADLAYGGQGQQLVAAAAKPVEERAADTIPAPRTPATR